MCTQNLEDDCIISNAVKPFVQSPLNDRDPFDFDGGQDMGISDLGILMYLLILLIKLENFFSLKHVLV